MNRWDLWTWIAILILGPGAIVIFLAFLRDVKKLLRDLKDNTHEQ